MLNSVEDRLKEQGIEFQKTHRGNGAVPFKIVDDLLFITGISPIGEDGKPAFVGRIGAEFTVEEGYRAGRLVALNMLQVIQDALGDLDRVDYFIKVMALVSAVKGNGDMNKVADGFSDVMVEKFGERGMHARNAVGASTLNANVPIVCDAIIKIRN